MNSFLCMNFHTVLVLNYEISLFLCCTLLFIPIHCCILSSYLSIYSFTNRDRTHLMVEQREIFTVPIETRHKQGLDAMALWIETAKLIIESKMKTGQKTITQCIQQCLFIKRPYNKRQKREKEQNKTKEEVNQCKSTQ